MGRKKSRPVRSRGILTQVANANGISGTDAGTGDVVNVKISDGNAVAKEFFVDVDDSHWGRDDHLDIAEIVLKDIKLDEGITDHGLIEGRGVMSDIHLRFKVQDAGNCNLKVGFWPVISADSISLEFLETNKYCSEDDKTSRILFSGYLDGPDESLSGLLHLVSLKYMTLRPLLPVQILGNASSVRLRVEILKNAFDACESLVEVIRKPWKKSMISVISWLRPEVKTSECRYGIDHWASENTTEMSDVEGECVASGLQAEFDAAKFYEAIKPSKNEPMLGDELPELVPQLRPYQRRAVFWMIQREQGLSASSVRTAENQLYSPFCVPLSFLDGTSQMFFNPFG